MRDAAVFLSLFLLARFLGRSFSWGAAGVWANLLWFLYQNEWGTWLSYLRGLGVGLVLAMGYGKPPLVWALLPWPLALYLRFHLGHLLPYLYALGEGMMAGLLLYLLGLRRR
ncbi:MAG: hypothetical protein ACUVQC_02370 [Thermaceae bacterium]